MRCATRVVIGALAWVGGLGVAVASVPQAVPAALVGVHPSGRVSMDVRDADVRAVVEQLGAVGRVNVVMPDHVQGRVTVRVKNVGWKQALQVVLRARGLDAQLEGNVLFVDHAPSVQAQREEDAMKSWCTRDQKLPADTFCRRP
jgi:type II secretory pathway component HofQ